MRFLIVSHIFTIYKWGCKECECVNLLNISHAAAKAGEKKFSRLSHSTWWSSFFLDCKSTLLATTEYWSFFRPLPMRGADGCVHLWGALRKRSKKYVLTLALSCGTRILFMSPRTNPRQLVLLLIWNPCTFVPISWSFLAQFGRPQEGMMMVWQRQNILIPARLNTVIRDSNC